MADMSSNEIHIEIPPEATVYITYSLLEVKDGEPEWVEREHEVKQHELNKVRIVTANGVLL